MLMFIYILFDPYIINLIVHECITLMYRWAVCVNKELNAQIMNLA